VQYLEFSGKCIQSETELNDFKNIVAEKNGEITYAEINNRATKVFKKIAKN
jgi:hypothetical protein